MGAQWKKAGKTENAQKKSKIVHRLTKEIMVAAKLGDPSPDNNPRLRAAVEAARKNSVPKDNIERAIKKGAGLLDEQVQYELVTFEGFAPHNIPLIVECLTDNRNRTSSDIKSLFRKGQLGAIGSVGWMFDRVGIVEATHSEKSLDIEEVAIEAGAQNVETLDASDIPEGHIGARFICETTDLDSVNKFLSQKGWLITTSELGYIPKNYPEVNEEQLKEVTEFLQDIDELDDVHRVYAALK